MWQDKRTGTRKCTNTVLSRISGGDMTVKKKVNTNLGYRCGQSDADKQK